MEVRNVWFFVWLFRCFSVTLPRVKRAKSISPVLLLYSVTPVVFLDKKQPYIAHTAIYSILPSSKNKWKHILTYNYKMNKSVLEEADHINNIVALVSGTFSNNIWCTWCNLDTSIFGNSSSIGNNTRSRLPSRLPFRFLW